MTEILEKMIAADVIMMATPVYFYTMCGQMKTLVDSNSKCTTKLIEDMTGNLAMFMDATKDFLT